MKLKSTGQNLIGVMMNASHIHVAKENGTYYLEFDFNIGIVGKIIKWNVD